MTISVKIDKIVASFFRNMIREEAQVRNFVELFVKDIEQEVSSEESFKTIETWQKFLSVMLGDISDLTKDDLSELSKILRSDVTNKCSMVTQSLGVKYSKMKDSAEEPLYGKYSLILPVISRLA